MLRSLVGSEMCIRDSLMNEPEYEARMQEKRKLAAEFGIPLIVVEPNDICLLYTSDAADDLLCVDLGGRRIIKKKKNYSKIYVLSCSHIAYLKASVHYTFTL